MRKTCALQLEQVLITSSSTSNLQGQVVLHRRQQLVMQQRLPLRADADGSSGRNKTAIMLALTKGSHP